jgi:hypothetical protein
MNVVKIHLDYHPILLGVMSKMEVKTVKLTEEELNQLLEYQDVKIKGTIYGNEGVLTLSFRGDE